jgi:hypothetical protein
MNMVRFSYNGEIEQEQYGDIKENKERTEEEEIRTS